MITKPLKVVGVGCNWTDEVARQNKEKLCEVGFYARILKLKEHNYVIYSYRNFTQEEAVAILRETIMEE